MNSTVLACLGCDGDHAHVADLVGAADEQVQLGPAAVLVFLPVPVPVPVGGRGGQQQRTEQRGRAGAGAGARQRNLLQRLQRQQVVDLHQGRAGRQQRHCEHTTYLFYGLPCRIGLTSHQLTEEQVRRHHHRSRRGHPLCSASATGQGDTRTNNGKGRKKGREEGRKAHRVALRWPRGRRRSCLRGRPWRRPG